jgi:hypothetical protein
LNRHVAVELAALASAYSRPLIESIEPLPREPLAAYWQHARDRAIRWTELLESRSDDSASAASTRHVVEDLLTSEILTRVWSTVLAAADRQRGVSWAEPIVQHVWSTHQSARMLALRWLTNPSADMHSAALDVDRLRRRAERWTDLLLGHLVERYGVADFAFDADRARDFGREQLEDASESSLDAIHTLVLAGLRNAFPPQAPLSTMHASHRGVISAVVALLPCSTTWSRQPCYSKSLYERIRDSALQPEGPLKRAQR